MQKQEWAPWGRFINGRWLPTALRIDVLPDKEGFLSRYQKRNNPVFDNEVDALTYCDWDYLKHGRNVDNRTLAKKQGDKPKYQYEPFEE